MNQGIFHSMHGDQEELQCRRVCPLGPHATTGAPRRYSGPLPGDRVQIDTMKVSTGRFQSTAIDNCTRLRVLDVYPWYAYRSLSIRLAGRKISWKIGCFLWKGSRSNLPCPSEDPLILVNLVHQKLEVVRISLIASELSVDW